MDSHPPSLLLLLSFSPSSSSSLSSFSTGGVERRAFRSFVREEIKRQEKGEGVEPTHLRRKSRQLKREKSASIEVEILSSTPSQGGGEDERQIGDTKEGKRRERCFSNSSSDEEEDEESKIHPSPPSAACEEIELTRTLSDRSLPSSPITPTALSAARRSSSSSSLLDQEHSISIFFSSSSSSVSVGDPSYRRRSRLLFQNLSFHYAAAPAMNSRQPSSSFLHEGGRARGGYGEEEEEDSRNPHGQPYPYYGGGEEEQGEDQHYEEEGGDEMTGGEAQAPGRKRDIAASLRIEADLYPFYKWFVATWTLLHYCLFLTIGKLSLTGFLCVTETAIPGAPKYKFLAADYNVACSQVKTEKVIGGAGVLLWLFFVPLCHFFFLSRKLQKDIWHTDKFSVICSWPVYGFRKGYRLLYGFQLLMLDIALLATSIPLSSGTVQTTYTAPGGVVYTYRSLKIITSTQIICVINVIIFFAVILVMFRPYEQTKFGFAALLSRVSR
ncbi:concanavalin a-like lectin glucanase family protein [Cystoisospora suis]|uniref:Concanavalin a-like lectin glucanase family protein n=1 Tax=Cystoisospora suis TaxID=483139 RepID=A0A2C6LAS1_9APIC|nr:concanavalin a-like lectin glucanase family protein [Cystoisospora suis]